MKRLAVTIASIAVFLALTGGASGRNVIPHPTPQPSASVVVVVQSGPPVKAGVTLPPTDTE